MWIDYIGFFQCTAAFKLRCLSCLSSLWCCFLVDCSIFLSNPSADWIWFHIYFEHSCTSLHVLWTIACIPSFSTVSQVNSIISAIVVIVVVMSSCNPFYCFLFFHCSEQTSIKRPTTYFFAVFTIEQVIIVQVSEFW